MKLTTNTERVERDREGEISGPVKGLCSLGIGIEHCPGSVLFLPGSLSCRASLPHSYSVIQREDISSGGYLI